MNVFSLGNPLGRVPVLTLHERSPRPAKPATATPGPVEKRTSLLAASKPSENQSGLPSRAALRVAIAAEAQAAGAAEEAAAAAGRGLAAVERAEQAMTPFATLDERAAAHHAGVARAGEAPGRGLPPDLLEGRRARAAAAEGLDDARAAHRLLAGEAEAARVAVVQATFAVAAEEADRLLTRARELEREAATIRHSLMRFANGRVLSDPPIAGSLTSYFSEGQHGPLLVAYGFDRPAMTGGIDWRGFRAALACDPDTRLEGAPA